MVGLLFPGQGSQFVGMGRELAESYAEARAVFEEADEALGFPLSRLCWEGPEEELTATENAQPALFVHSLAVHRVVAQQLGPVRYAAGHSLGEFSAYVAAGAMSFIDGVRTVRRRGELMYRGGLERPGTMAAILGMSDEEVEHICREVTVGGGQCVPANYNSPGQIVISGDTSSVEAAMELARDRGAKLVKRLNVSGAFHSPLMKVAEAGLEAQLASVALQPPAFDVVSNVTGQPAGDLVELRRLLVQQLTSPVRWTACMHTMVDGGVTEFYELGAGSVLTKLVKRIARQATAHAVGAPEELAAMERG